MDFDDRVRRVIAEQHDEIEALRERNAALIELASHLYYVKPPEVDAIFYDGRVIKFDDLMEKAGLRWEATSGRDE